jgi:hypothetical protein
MGKVQRKEIKPVATVQTAPEGVAPVASSAPVKE